MWTHLPGGVGGGGCLFLNKACSVTSLWTRFTGFVQMIDFLHRLSGVCSVHLPRFRDHGKIPKQCKTRRSWSNFPTVFLSIKGKLRPVFPICLLWYRPVGSGRGLTPFDVEAASFLKVNCHLKLFTVKMWTGWTWEPHQVEHRGVLKLFVHHIPQGHLKTFWQWSQSAHSRSSCIISGVLCNNT